MTIPTGRDDRTDVLQSRFEHAGFAWTARPDHVRARTELLRAVLPPRSHRPLTLVDLGCGAGINTSLVATELGVRGVGLDWAFRPLGRARERGLAVVQGLLDGADLPFGAGSVDAVMLSEVIEHLVDTDGVIGEARRVLRPGGALLVTTPNLAAWFNRILLAVGVQPVFSEVSARKVFGRPGKEIVGHLRLFTRRALVGFLEDAGFADVRLVGSPFHGVPRPARGLDRFLARWPDLAATLLAVAVKPA